MKRVAEKCRGIRSDARGDAENRRALGPLHPSGVTSLDEKSERAVLWLSR